MRYHLLIIFVATSCISLISAGSVSVCRDIKQCDVCADSFIHVLGFREQCRWCVESGTCGGPLSCPLGKPVVQRDPFRCPTKYSLAKGKRYTDELGRSLFVFPLALRDKNATKCLQNVRPDVSYSKSYTVECDDSGNKCSALLAVSEEAKAIYVAYKGSTFDKQLLAEFIHGLAAQLGAWEKFESDEAGVITYFHTAFYRLFSDSGMKDDLLELKAKHPQFRVWVTGHSLGGSLASMTALYLTKMELFESPLVRLITFGEPRTGNVAYAKEIEKYVSFRYRVVKKNDGVTNLPHSVDPNTPLLTTTMHDRQPLFYRYLVHYDNDMSKGTSFKLCEQSDDHGCRNLAIAADFSDHVSYFGVNADDFVAKGCPKSYII